MTKHQAKKQENKSKWSFEKAIKRFEERNPE